jgi:uncharacterized protein (DUF1330 family)
MKHLLVPGLTMLAGVIIGATAINGLHAQGKTPAAYAVVVIDEVTDPDSFKTIVPKAIASISAVGGHYLARNDVVTATEGAAPKRLVLIAFDNMDKLKAWDSSAAQKEVNAIRLKATKSRQFFVEGLPN